MPKKSRIHGDRYRRPTERPRAFPQVWGGGLGLIAAVLVVIALCAGSFISPDVDDERAEAAVPKDDGLWRTQRGQNPGTRADP